MKMNIFTIVGALSAAAVLSGCGSAYSGLADSTGLGAGQYMPAVHVEPGNEGRYGQVLGVCRQVAVNRQATAAQKAQLETLTGVVEGVGSGAASGLEFGSLLDNAGWDTSAGEGALIGAAAGAIASLASAFASGAEDTVDETRRILLNCLRTTSKDGTLWQVLE